MEFTIFVEHRAALPVRENQLFEIAAIGVCCGNPGGRRLDAVLTVKAPDYGTAARKAIRAVRMRIPGDAKARPYVVSPWRRGLPAA